MAKRIIDLIYSPDFFPAILAFQILLIGFVVGMLTSPLNHALIVFNQQKKFFWISLSGAVVNIILNLILVPSFSLYGASLATLCTFLLMFFLVFKFTLKTTFLRPLNKQIALTFLIALISGILMYFIISSPFFSKLYLPWLILIAFLALGFFIFGKFEEKQLKEYQVQLEEIQEKVNLAETYLLVGKTNPQAEKKANSLFKESWQEISPLVNIASTFPSDFANQVLNLKKTIAFNLSQLNKLEIIEKPELFFEFKAREYIPQKMIAISSELYFFSPYSQNIFELSKQGEGKILSIDKKFNLATALPNSLLFFSSSNQLVNFKDGQFSDFISLQPPYSNFNFDQLLSYQSNLYFLDKTAGKIVKYPYLGNLRWGSPQLWLRSETKKTTNFESVAVDGAIWALTKNNSIEKYYAGRLEKTLKWEIFPEPKSFKKLFTSPRLPYLYILEPIQKRVVVLDKSGQIKKQFQSEDFANLLDFAVSPDGKTIWLLNGLKVYQVKL